MKSTDEASAEKMKAEEIALLITPLLHVADLALSMIDLQAAWECLEKMEAHQRTLEALPFPETMNRAEKRGAENETLKALIVFLEARERQRDCAGKSSPFASGAEILKLVGEGP